MNIIADSFYKCELVEKKKLYGFDAHKLYQFIKLTFTNTTVMNKVKKLWYDEIKDKQSRWGTRRILKDDGYRNTQIYETVDTPIVKIFSYPKF